MPQAKNGLFYGWYIVLTSFLIMFSAFSIVNSLHSLFLVPVTSELGMSRTTFSIVLSVGGLGIALASPFMGKLLMKGNMKFIMSVCIILAGCGFMLYSFAQSPVHFAIIAFCVGVSVAGFSNIPISIMLTNWFYEKKGLAMGLAFAGSGIGTAALSPILTTLISTYGWRTTYVIAGVLIIVISLPLILLFTKKSPADKGTIALGANRMEETQVNTLPSGVTLAEAKKSGMFWLFIFGVVCFALVAGGVQMHIPAYLIDIGHPALFAGTIFGLLSLSNTVGKLILGAIFDKFKTKGGVLFVGVCMTIAMLSLLMANTKSFAFIFAIAYGFSIVISSIGPPFMTDDLFGKKDFGAIFGFVQVFFVATSSIGVIVSGLIYDLTQSYKVAWIIFLALFIISMLSILIANGMKKKNVVNVEEVPLEESMEGI